MKRLAFVLFVCLAARADEGSLKLLNLVVDDGGVIQLLRSSATLAVGPQLQWCLSGGTCNTGVAGGWVLGPDAAGNMLLQAGTGSGSSVVLSIDSAGNLTALNNGSFGGRATAAQLDFTGSLASAGTTVMNSTQDLLNIHSYASNTGNFTIAGDSIQMYRNAYNTGQQIGWNITGMGAVNGWWGVGPDGLGNFAWYSGLGGVATDVFHITSAGVIVSLGNIDAPGVVVSGTLRTNGNLNDNGVVVLNSTQDLLAIHSYTSNTGNFTIAGDSIQMYRNAYNTGQQIGWNITGMGAVNGWWGVGPDGLGNFAWYSGLGGVATDVFHITSAGVIVSLGNIDAPGVVVSGTLRTNGNLNDNGVVVLNSTQDLLAIHSYTSNTGNFTIAGDSIQMYRNAYNTGQQIGWNITGMGAVNGSWALGPDGLGDFTLYSGAGGMLTDVFHVTPNGNVSLPATLSAGSGAFSGTVTATTSLVAPGTVKFAGLSAGSSGYSLICIDSSGFLYKGCGSGVTAPLVLSAPGFADNTNDGSTIEGLLGSTATSQNAVLNYFHNYTYEALRREGSLVGATMTGTSDANWETDGVIGMVVNNTSSTGTRAGSVAGAFYALANASNATVWGLNVYTSDINHNLSTSLYDYSHNSPAITIGMEMDLHAGNTGSTVSGINAGIAYLGITHTNAIAGAVNVNLTGGNPTNYFDYGLNSGDGAALVGIRLGLGNNGSSGSACSAVYGGCTAAAIVANSQFLDITSGTGDAYTARIWGDAIGELVFLPNHVYNSNTIKMDASGNLLVAAGATVDGALSAGVTTVNDPGANLGLEVLSGSGASALRLWTNDPTMLGGSNPNRNWNIQNRYSGYGVLELRVSTAAGGNPDSGTLVAEWDASGNMTEYQNLTVNGTLSGANASFSGSLSAVGLSSTGGFTAAGNITSTSGYIKSAYGYYVGASQVIDGSLNYVGGNGTFSGSLSSASLSVSGTLTAGTFAPSSISTGTLAVTSTSTTALTLAGSMNVNSGAIILSKFASVSWGYNAGVLDGTGGVTATGYTAVVSGTSHTGLSGTFHAGSSGGCVVTFYLGLITAWGGTGC